MIVGVGVFLCAQTTIGVVAIVLGMLGGGLDPAKALSTSSKDLFNNPAVFLPGAIASAVVAVAGYWILMRLLRQRPVAEMGGPGILKELGVGLALGAALIALVFAVLAIVGAYRIVQVGWNGGILVGLGVGIMAGFAEEILFRGVILRLLEAWLGSWWEIGRAHV